MFSFGYCPNYLSPPTVGQEAVELICHNAQKTRQNQAMSLWPLLSTKTKLISKKVKKNDFWPKKHFWPCQWWLWPIGSIKRPAERPNDYLLENRMYPELPQDMGEIWPHWVRSIWPQKWGLYGFNVKNADFWAKNGLFGGQKCCFGNLKKCCFHHDGEPKRQPFCVDRIAGRAPGWRGPFLVQKSDSYATSK